jgi:hypothetical protein
MWAPFGTRPAQPASDTNERGSTSYGRIGRYWMQGGYCGSIGKCHTVWSNWRDRQRHIDEHDDLSKIRDLNSPDADEAPHNTWSTVQSEGPYLLFDEVTQAEGPPRVTLVLKRGDRRTTIGPVSDSPSLSAGLVSWRRGGKARSYDVRTRARGVWWLPAAGIPQRILHTSRYILTTVYDEGRYRTYWARIRR